MGPHKLKIINKTEYRTDDLRRFIVAGFREFGISLNREVEIVYARTDEVNGKATYPEGPGDDWMWFALPAKNLSLFEFAQVLQHEAQHAQGLRHRDMVHWAEFRPTWHRNLEIRYRKTAKHRRKK